MNIANTIFKFITYRALKSLNAADSHAVLRRKIIGVFKKRIFKVASKFEGFRILTFFVSLALAMNGIFIEETFEDIDFHILVCHLVTVIKTLIVFVRFANTFYSVGEDLKFDNYYKFKEISFGSETGRCKEILGDEAICAICWNEYEVGE